MCIGPQASARGTRLGLQRHQIVARGNVMPVDPGHAGGHLMAGHILAAAFDPGNAASVAVGFQMLDPGMGVQAQAGQAAARCVTVGLVALRRINGMDAHLLALVRVRAAHVQGVAIADADDQADEDRGKHPPMMPQVRAAARSKPAPALGAGPRPAARATPPIPGTPGVNRRGAAFPARPRSAVRAARQPPDPAPGICAIACARQMRGSRPGTRRPAG